MGCRNIGACLLCDNATLVDRSKGYNRRARKIIHLTGGLPALFLPLFPEWLVLAGAVVGAILAYALKPTHAWWLRYITKPEDRKRGEISGVRSYFISILALVVLWLALHYIGANHPPLQLLGLRLCMFGWLALALGDGLAGLLGPSPSRTSTVPWNKHKTWWGMLGCFVGAGIAYAATMLLTSRVYTQQPLETGTLIIGALVAGAFVALAESKPSKIDDNYNVVFAAALVLLLLQLNSYAG